MRLLILARLTMDFRYKIGEAFIFLPQSDALVRLERDTESVNKEIEETESQIEDVETEMKTLKGLLYGKFGDAINLEA